MTWRRSFGASPWRSLRHARSSEGPSTRAMRTNLVVVSIALEGLAVAYAIMTTRSLDLNWQMRAVRVMPLFVLPVLAVVIYSTLGSVRRMLDSKDQKALERLREERQAKITELKERTNYYTTQQLIQRYDLDPAAKAAAATVLASKLGADSGLKFYVGDESNTSPSLGVSNDVNPAQPTQLRHRKPASGKSAATVSNQEAHFFDDSLNEYDENAGEIASPNQSFVGHNKGSAGSDGGWLARIAALLVGEDPTQCYALICSNCHMHNGFARKEDFLFITYYCPHCHALNGSRQQAENEMILNSERETPISQADGNDAFNDASNSSSITGSPFANTPTAAKEMPQGDNGDEEGNDVHTN
ncbi:Uncharacterized protein ACMD2_11407 [Ananas comosus]|uniref:Lunapark zinc ribbon domain-containing protein n=1 Tax=Ananas comosus TaxID=4615 RepID=A0A199ULN9_ANACO|nr:Uncharacterized protein ACMD2_11407 [Ananas comosus]